jgi:hypothetical protein
MTGASPIGAAAETAEIAVDLHSVWARERNSKRTLCA